MTAIETHDAPNMSETVAAGLMADRGGPALDPGRQSDIALIGALKAGDETAFDDLVRKYQHRVFQHCLRRGQL